MRRQIKAQFGNTRFRQIIHVQAKEIEPCWVKVGFLTEKTGWNPGQLRRARKQGLVKYKKDDDGSMWYNLHSVSSLFLVK